MAAQLTGSGMDRAEACPASAALPAIQGGTSKAAEYGNAIHKYLEDGTITPGYEDDCAGVDLEFARPRSDNEWREATYAWNPATRTGLFVGCGLERDYSAVPPGSIPVTLDRVWIADHGLLHVDDYKTGRDLPNADTLQLGLGAICTSKAYQDVVVSLVHLPEGGPDARVSKALDAIDLGLIEDRVAAVWAHVQAARAVVASGKTPDVRVGPHCKYCPAMASCPAYAGLVRKMLGTEDMVSAIEIMPFENVAAAYLQVQMAEGMVEKLKDACTARLAQADGPVPLPNGGAIKAISTERRYVTLAKAKPVFAEFGITPVTKETITIKAIEEAAGKQASAVMRALHDARALTYKDTTSLRIVKGG